MVERQKGRRALDWKQFQQLLIQKQQQDSMDPKMGSSVDSHFVTTLFSHPEFRVRLSQAVSSCKGWVGLEHPKSNGQELSALTQQISGLLYRNFEDSLALLTRHLQHQIASIHLELDKIKDSIAFTAIKADFTSKQLFQEAPQEDEYFYDLPSIKRTIHFLQQKIKEISPDSSTVLESADASKENKNIEEYLQNKISSICEQVEHRLLTRHQALEENINKRLQKQQKTINNILETLNDSNGPTLAEKSSNMLANSKSATKLKSFFGFR